MPSGVLRVGLENLDDVGTAEEFGPADRVAVVFAVADEPRGGLPVAQGQRGYVELGVALKH